MTRVFVGPDRQDWDGIGAVLGDCVALDYASLTGGKPGEHSRQDLLAAWRRTPGGFERTQHLLGSLVGEMVSPSEVRMPFHAAATHVLHAGLAIIRGRFAGHNDAVLRRGKAWPLAALTFHLDWSAVSQQLATLAAAGAGR